MRADTRLSLRFDRKLRSRLRKRAKLLGQSESEYVRSAIEKQLDSDSNVPSALALIRKYTRFIGPTKGLPPDTSTNESYMEGFGTDTE